MLVRQDNRRGDFRKGAAGYSHPHRPKGGNKNSAKGQNNRPVRHLESHSINLHIKDTETPQCGPPLRDHLNKLEHPPHHGVR